MVEDINCVCANFPAEVSFIEGRSGNSTFPIEASILVKYFDSFLSISLQFPMYNLKSQIKRIDFVGLKMVHYNYKEKLTPRNR